ncbi:MAG: cysteine dioxygenase family protein [Chloroflexi bacterium]|nr:cysteine dioxygenase family protein [Chloroflexota bacterium]
MNAVTHSTLSPALEQLVSHIEAVLALRANPHDTAHQVAAELGPFLDDPQLLLPSQREPDPNCYRQHVLHVADDGQFSIVALVWLPGQTTCIHDHVSWCVVGVYEGREQERQYEVADSGGDAYLQPVGVSYNEPGSVAALTPPGDIHQVVNPGPGLAISIHVYGADIGKLGSSIRRRYELPIKQDEQEARVVADCEPIS